MEYQRIQTALTDHLKTLPNLPELFEEGDSGFLQSDEAVGTRTSSYIRTLMEPLRSSALTLGQSGEDIYPLNFIIQQFTPQGSGTKFTNNFADDLARLFKRGNSIVIEPGLCVSITRAYKNPNIHNTNFTQSTFIIEAECIITRA